jgi:hypothetical protein
VLVLWGPGGSGKTEVGASKAVATALKWPGNVIFLCRRKKEDLRLTLWKRFVERLPAELVVTKDDHRCVRTLKNGTEIYGLGFDSIEDVNKLAGTECGLVVVEEATETPFEYFDQKIRRSCRKPGAPYHQVVLMCNPGTPTHWIKKLIDSHDKDVEDILMPTIPESCGILPKTFYAWLAGLKGIFALRYRDGQWVALEGLVYPFDPKMQVIPRFDIPKSWPRVRSHDFGFSLLHPAVTQWWARSPDDKWYLYRQLFQTRKTVKTISVQIKHYDALDGVPVDPLICDTDCEDRQTFEENGIATRPAYKDHRVGQALVFDAFETNRIFFFQDSLVEVDMERQIAGMPTSTEEQLEKHIWKDSVSKEDWRDEEDDGPDTMRYAMATTNRHAFVEPRSVADAFLTAMVSR